MYNVNVLSVGFRFLTLAAKFLIAFFLARFLDPHEFGLYGLLLATITYSIYIVGLDFYNFSTRELCGNSLEIRGQLLKSQVALMILQHLTIGPFLLLIFSYELLPWYLVYWFYTLLVLEHINQEVWRMFAAISRPVTASLLLFLRSGLWVFFVIYFMSEFEDLRSLEFIFLCWTIGGLIAIFMSFYVLKNENIKGWSLPVNWKWIRQGLLKALPLLISTLVLQAVYTIDRYWFQLLNGLPALGAYILFIGICNSLVSFLDAGVFSFIYPKLIELHRRGEVNEYEQLMKKLLINTLVLAFVFSLAAIVVMPLILNWIGKPVYISMYGAFNWLLLGTVFFSLSMVPHFGLYAKGLDRIILNSHIVGLIVFICVAWLFCEIDPALAIPYAFCAAFSAVLIFKTIKYFANKTLVNLKTVI
jgi:O-antigen/teichoic acid export membrane protein